ncbi:RAD54 [Symbiodinium sp. CCMP2592]|nr:RAD54 [Symbiodinium sp. CCMP2592]
MGMGKTFQATVLACIFVLADPSFIVHIVCPAALMDQWQAELQHVFGAVPPAVKILSMDSKEKPCASGLLILDEIHLIKNKRSKRYNRFLDWPCSLRLGLTGTPIQNDLVEFLAIVALLRPGQEIPAVNLTVVRDAREPGATLEKIGEAEKQLSSLQAFTCDFMLQREMDSHALPRKTTHLVFLPLPERVRVQYQKTLDEASSATARKSASIETLENLNKVLYSMTNGNPKFDYVKTWLRACEGKCVICSSRLDVLEALTKLLVELDVDFAYFTGTQKDREEHLKAFANLPSVKVLLLSKGCGAAGLNLTSASHMLLMEPAWNPSQDAQAQARVWRLGQKRPCFITRLIFAGCLEEKILQRQTYKRGLWKQELETADVEQRQLRDIWFFKPETSCATWESLSNKEGVYAEMHGMTWQGVQLASYFHVLVIDGSTMTCSNANCHLRASKKNIYLYRGSGKFASNCPIPAAAAAKAAAAKAAAARA